MDVRVEGKKVDDGFVTLGMRVAACEIPALERGAYLVVAKREGVDIGGEGTAREILDAELGSERVERLSREAMKKFVAPFALSADGGDYSVVGAPTMSDGEAFDDDGDLLFEATWVRLPRLELSSYEPVEIVVPPIQVSEAEIDDHLDQIADSYKTIERDKSRTVVEDGSIAEISMDCRKDGERMPQLCFAHRPYRAGSNQMPAGFDEALIGAKVGQTVHVDFVLPLREDIDGTMTGPSITADVTVEAIMREVGRVLTDEFVANNIPNASSIADLREQARAEIAQKKADQMRHFRNFFAARELAKRLEGSIPDEAYDAVADQMVDQLAEQARFQHTTVSDLLKQQGTNEEQFRMMALMQARTQLRQSAALDAWARHRGIVVDDADIDAFFASSEQRQGQGAQMRSEAENGGFSYLAREGALRLKASEDVVACAHVREDANAEMPEGMPGVR